MEKTGNTNIIVDKKTIIEINKIKIKIKMTKAHKKKCIYFLKNL